MVPSQLNSRLGFVNPGLTLNTMIPWYHTMVFVHIHIYTQVYRSLQYDTCHHTYIYIWLYIHILYCKLSRSWTNAVYFLLHQNPEFGQIRISYDLLTGGLCIHVISCYVITVYNPQKQSLSQCPGHTPVESTSEVWKFKWHLLIPGVLIFPSKWCFH